MWMRCIFDVKVRMIEFTSLSSNMMIIITEIIPFIIPI